MRPGLIVAQKHRDVRSSRAVAECHPGLTPPVGDWPQSASRLPVVL